MVKNSKTRRRNRIHRRVRAKVFGTAERPRLNVFKSSKHIYAQIIDDNKGNTLCAVSTLNKEVASDIEGKQPIERAEVVGKAIAAKAKEAGIDTVTFDRGGYKYHGKIKALAIGAREGGLKF